MNSINKKLNEITSEIAESIRFSDLKKRSEAIRERYRDKNSREEDFEIHSVEDALSYAVYRMPQTASVILEVLSRLTERFKDYLPNTVLDIGGGTGAALLPLNEFFKGTEVTVLEEQEQMIKAMEAVFQKLDLSLKVKTVKKSLLDIDTDNKYSLILSSYMINELNDEELKKTADILDKITGDFFIAVVPGTPLYFKKLEYLKSILLERGFSIIAPCIGTHVCHLSGDDWCHFMTRVERSSVLRRIKEGELSYEDEKFSYVILKKDGNSKTLIEENHGELESEGRIIRHPLTGKGYFDFEICLKNGVAQKRVSRSMVRDFKSLKKLKWGDILIIKK